MINESGIGIASKNKRDDTSQKGIEMILNRSRLVAYRVFDIAHEIDLQTAQKNLDQDSGTLPVTILERLHSAAIQEKSLNLSLPEQRYQIGEQWIEAKVNVKLWSFGAASFSFRVNFDDSRELAELNKIAIYFEKDSDFHKSCRNLAEKLQAQLGHALTIPNLWDQTEDYLIFNCEPDTSVLGDLKQIAYSDEVISAILTEKSIKFSDWYKDTFQENTFQYTRDDFFLIHWNGAFIVEKEDYEHCFDAIEYALCQLLELRYYDWLLDTQLGKLYSKIETAKPSIWKDPYAELSKYALLDYMEISDVVERIDNAFKFAGDYYYAAIYKKATERFHLAGWRKSIDEKRHDLAELTKICQGGVHERRSIFLEIVIIILIAIEVIPFLWEAAKFFLSE